LARFGAPALLLFLVFGQASEGGAASFSIDPTQIRLSARASSGLLTVRNESVNPVRLQLTAFAWSQSLTGAMQLEATEDVVFFPSLLTLAPGQERKVRVGTTRAFGAVEQSYRLFVEELPAEPGVKLEGAAVQVLTKMGIPVFLQPAAPRAQAALTELGQRDGAVAFRLENTGTVHFVPDSVRIRGSISTGEAVIDRNIQSWYVLAGGARVFTVSLDPPVCGQIRSLQIEVQVSGTMLHERLETPNGTCRP
jgi:fimbrial chaperone protein